MDKLRFLHIVKDDKFFDSVFSYFEQVESLENEAVLLVKNADEYRFKLIKKTEKVQLVDKRGLKMIMQEGLYDVVFFHSLPFYLYKFMPFIPENKKIIWWCWGYDIYDSVKGMAPIVDVPLYKPLTQNLVKKRKNLIKSIIKKLFLAPYYSVLRHQVIPCIDYFQPVIPLEYQLMLSVKGFRAKEFYYPNCFSNYSNQIDCTKQIDGGILIGNSPTLSNNHLDVWLSAKKFIPADRKIIIPLNYPGCDDIANEISQKIHSEKHELVFLRHFLPREEYFKMIENCSYAIFGVMRQQAMGNINYCLNHGLKVFLYRDSLVYRFLKENGYVVFAIEDIDKNSFLQPLSKTEIAKNALAFIKEKEYIDGIQDNVFRELTNIKNGI